MLDMTDSQTIRLRSATLKDVRDMAIIKLSNKSTFADLLSGMGDCSSSTDSAIKLQEFDIQGRLASQNALVMVATVQNADNDHELVAGWALWKVFDDPQPLEEKPPDRHVNGESERTVLSRACQADFKKALVSGRNAHTAGKCNIRKYSMLFKIDKEVQAQKLAP